METGSPATRKPLICIVYSSADLTGAFVAIKREAELMRDDAEFLLVLPKVNRIPDDQLEPFSGVLTLPIFDLRRSPLVALRYVAGLVSGSLRLRRLLGLHGCERVQMNCFTLHHGAMLRLLGFRGTIVTWVRSEPSRLRSMGWLSLRLASRASDSLIVVSKHVQSQLPRRMKSRLVYDPAREVPMIGASEGPALVLMGNYIPMKGQDFAIEAFHRVAERHPRARLVMHGNRTGLDGGEAYYARLQDLAAAGPGAGRIHFGEFVPLAEGLAGKRAALMVSRWEPFGLACQDASAHGLPVIATRSGGPEEMIDDGRTGFLVDVGDIAALAERMDRLLADVDLATSMGDAGRTLMREHFPVARFKQDLREIFSL